MTITKTGREAQRAHYRAEALRRANLKGRTITCEYPDPTAHATCHGLTAATSPLGCLCPCHDGDAT